MSCLVVVLLWWAAVLTVPPFTAAEVYQYVDAHGVVSLTNVPSDPRFRKLELESSGIRPILSEHDLAPMIARHSRQHGLHPALVRAVIKAESDFDPTAVSKAGAVGLMQLMPQTAIRLDVRDMYDPDENIRGGATYLRYLLDRFEGNLALALAAYNAGEHVVDRYQALPPIDETRHYVTKVLNYYRRFLSHERAASASRITSRVRATELAPLVFSATSPR
ncbi:MAG: lytic transglycosylase domain-containing protein [Nitrospiraceae bacterium]